jgi:hypothetical protein
MEVYLSYHPLFFNSCDMKKSNLLWLPLLLCCTLTAQTGNHLSLHKTISFHPPERGPLPVFSTSAVIWSDDFSNPSSWTISTPVGSGINKDWVIGTTGPSGAYAIPAIESTTASNGFALFDSDLNCSYDQVADITTAVPVNCSAYPFVRLSFEQQYRRFHDSTFVFVSNNGSSWTKYPVNETVGSDFGSSVNPEKISLDISAVAGSQPAVWIRFEYYSPNTLAFPAGCNYAWMIDDISISEIVSNDLAVDRPYCDFAYTNGGFYTGLPVAELVPIAFRAAVSNQGSSAQTSVQLNVKVSDGAGVVYDQNSAVLGSLPYQAKDTLAIAVPFSPLPAVKSYTVTFKASQAETELPADTVNNIAVNYFSVTDTVYARDNGTETSAVSPNAYIGGAMDGARIGLKYEFPAAATATSVSVFVDSASGLGTTIEAKLYEQTGSGFTEIVGSQPYAISSGISEWINLPLPYTALSAGKTYLAAIIATGISTGPDLFVYIGADNPALQPAGICQVYLPGIGYWDAYALLPMIRLNILNPYAGIRENNMDAAALFRSMPNPAKDNAVVSYELREKTNVRLELSDNAGRVLFSENRGEQPAGLYSWEINTLQLAPAAYHCSLFTGDGKKVLKMIVIK